MRQEGLHSLERRKFMEIGGGRKIIIKLFLKNLSSFTALPSQIGLSQNSPAGG